MANSILVKSMGVPNIEEIAAASAITPGMLVVRGASGMAAHSETGGNLAPVRVALEDSLQGNDKNDAYAANDLVRVWTPQAGDKGYLILSDGQSVAIGDELESAGNGYVNKYTADTVEAESSNEVSAAVTIYPMNIVAVADEAMDLSESSGEESSGEGAIDATLGYNRRIKVIFK